MVKLKSENGAITLYVVIALVIVIIGLVGVYTMLANKQMSDLEVSRRIKTIYEKDINNINEVYNNLVK